MREMKKTTCQYCGLHNEMPVVETGCVSNGKPIKMYKVRCPRCGQVQWVHDKNENNNK